MRVLRSILSASVLPALSTGAAAQCNSFGGMPTFDHPTGVSIRQLDVLDENNIWACGGNIGSGGLIAHYHDGAWTVHITPNVSGGDVYFEGISALSNSDVWATGYFQSGGVVRSAVLHYDGVAWTGELLPLADPAHNWAMSIEAIAPDNVWVVGFSGEYARYMAFHYDGRTWNAVDFPEPPAAVYAEFSGISATSASDVWISATTRIMLDDYESKTFHYDGRAWTQIDMPQPSSSPVLYEIAAASPDDAWAVGDKFVDGIGHQPLTYHWNGLEWTEVVAPMPGIGWNFLFGVDVAPDGRAYAAGYHYYGAVSEPIAIVYEPEANAWTGFDMPMVGYSTVAWGAGALPSGDGVIMGDIGYYGGEYPDPYLRQFRLQHFEGDTDCDGLVGFTDLTALLAAWGPCAGACSADLDGNTIVDFEDLLLLLANWD